MRYVTKKAQAEIMEYYEYCIRKRDEYLDEDNLNMADYYDSKVCCIKKIYEILRNHKYTKD